VGLCSHATSSRTRGDGFRLHQGRFRLGIRKLLFSRRALKHWHICQGLVESLCLEECGDVALGNMVSGHGWGGSMLDLVVFEVFSILNDSMIPTAQRSKMH